MTCFGLSSEPLIFLYTIIFTINYTVLPQLVLQKICLKQNDYNETFCDNLDHPSNEMQKESSEWWFYLLTCSLVPSVFTVLIWGPVTDVVGRRRAMIFVPLVNALRALVYLVNSYYLHSHVAYMLFGSVLSCFYGEFQGVVALCYAYMADITADMLEHRTMRMAFVEASVFFAGIPAGLLSGYLLQKLGYIPVFILTTGINVFILLHVVFFLPEPHTQDAEIISGETSLLHDERSGTDFLQDERSETDFLQDERTVTNNRKAYLKEYTSVVDCVSLLNPFQHFKQVLSVVTDSECKQVILPLVAAFGFSVCAVMGELIVQTLYLKNSPFVFSPEKIGYYSAVQAGIRGFGVIAITQLSFHFIHCTDYTLIFFGLMSQIACYILVGLARSTIVVFLVNITGLAVPVATTVLRSAITKQVSKENYGAVLALIEAMDAVAAVLTNALSLWTYNLTVTVYSGVVFFGLSGFSLVALLVVSIVFCLQRIRSQDSTN